MSTAFKKLSKSDISITPFNTHKNYSFTSASLVLNGGSFYSASYPTVAYRNGFGFEWAGTGSTDDLKNHKKFFQLDHLFYRNSKLEYHNKFSTIKYFDHYRKLYSKVNILSLPYKKIGSKIKPGSFSLTQEGITIKDDGKGNLFDTTADQFTDISSFADEKSRIFYIDPQGAYKYHNLNIKDGKQLVNAPTSYSEKNIYDDSFLLNPLEYKNVTFDSFDGIIKLSPQPEGGTFFNPIYSKIIFNGEDSTIVSPHNSRFNFNNDNDFTISFHVTGALFKNGIDDNKKRYLISKSTTKTIIPSSDITNNTSLTGSLQPIDIQAEPQFPFEIYHQSESIFFERYDGTNTTLVSRNIKGENKNRFRFSFIKTGSNIEFYLNNGSKTLTGSTTDITGETQNQANLYIGSKGGTSNFFTGSISQIMIFNKGLNENEVNALHASNDNKPHVGNIFYNNGLVTITKPTYQFILDPSRSLGTNHDFNLSYQGTHLIYENKYQCLAEQHEFKNTLNISARKVKSKNSQELANFTTGSNFSPFVTTIGLYNDNGELLVVGKLGQPIRMLDKIDTTFVVKFDN